MIIPQINKSSFIQSQYLYLNAHFIGLTHVSCHHSNGVTIIVSLLPSPLINIPHVYIIHILIIYLKIKLISGNKICLMLGEVENPEGDINTTKEHTITQYQIKKR